MILNYIRTAVEFDGQAAKRRAPNRKPVKIEVPKDLKAALKPNAKTRAVFEALSLSHQRGYIESASEARRRETREGRIATTLEWLTEGKPRN